ncbi:hypothetical protein Pme01_21770 [Planosporangium mesophilum]|uniref:Uncharacterized protein n=1 Tax=Planosporangium mesophilum TaxID=689768 RepID=A0A8J3WZR1_9ACTN|nr:hypothetical protein Pme01_21770 [Planosporangium mesophilum]
MWRNCSGAGDSEGRLAMIARGLFNAAVLVVECAGTALFVYAVFAVGLKGYSPTRRSIWGRAVTWPRAAFATYFGVMGLALSLSAHLFLFDRHDRTFLPLIIALVIIFLLLATGWAIVRKR